MIAFLLNIYYC